MTNHVLPRSEAHVIDSDHVLPPGDAHGIGAQEWWNPFARSRGSHVTASDGHVTASGAAVTTSGQSGTGKRLRRSVVVIAVLTGRYGGTRVEDCRAVGRRLARGTSADSSADSTTALRLVLAEKQSGLNSLAGTKRCTERLILSHRCALSLPSGSGCGVCSYALATLCPVRKESMLLPAACLPTHLLQRVRYDASA